MTHDREFGHLVGNRICTFSSQSINAGAYEKVGAKLQRRAEELVDVVFSIADMDTTAGIADKLQRLLHIGKPADAFFALDRHAGRVNVALERGCSLKLRARPKLDGGKPKRQTFRRYGKTRMHQQTAHGVQRK